MTNNGGVLDTPPEDELAAVCASGDNERVAELLAFGVDPNSRIGHDSYIAVASRAGNHVALSRLIRAGGKVSRPMLRDAIAGGNPRCADKVLDELHYEGVQLELDVEASQLLLERGFTASLTVDMLEWLKRQGVDLAVRSAHGTSLYELVQRDGGPAEMVAYLQAFHEA